MESKFLTVLKNNKLLKDFNLPDDKLSEIDGKLVTLNEGEMLYKEGDPAEVVYIVVDGEIKVIKKDEYGGEQLDSFTEDTYFGYELSEENINRTSTAIAAKGTYLIAISNSELEELQSAEPVTDIDFESDVIPSEEEFAEEVTMEEEIKSPFFDDDEEPEIRNLNLDEGEEDLLSEDILEDTVDDSVHLYETTSEENFEKEELADPEPVESSAEPEIKFDDIELSDKTAGQIEKINKAALFVNSDLKIEDVLENIVNVAADLTNADRGLIFLTEKDSEDIWSKVVVNGETKELRIKIGEGIAGEVAQSGQLTNLPDVSLNKNFSPAYDDLANYETKSMICLPIKNRNNEVIGVLQLLNSRNNQFTKLDEEFLKGLSIHAALALEKATLVEKLLQTERVSSIGKMANFLIQDIKKPLLVSKRYAEHLKSKELPDNTNQIVDMLIEQLNQVVDLVQATSGYSEGKIILRAINVSINDLLQDYANRMEKFLTDRKCKINFNLAEDAKVKIDSKEFFQCFNNIIKNACEAMPGGGEINISARVEGEQSVISFMDHGKGIEDSIKDDVFEPFTSFGKVNSAGLGLAITKKITEAHEGTVSLESNIDKGITVTLKLPVVSVL